MSLDLIADSGSRQKLFDVKGVTIVKPIVYGNIARYFGKKREEDGHTHQWTVFVKPFKNEDMSVYVKKMNFKLHESYANPNRIITKPPYEVTETGWGEFEVIIKVYFNDPNEKPVTIFHLLKLFQTDAEIMTGKKNLVAECYDEMVFQDPSSTMQKMLLQQRPITVGPYLHENNFEEKKQKHLALVKATSAKVKQRIQQVTEQLKQSKDEIQKFKRELSKLEGTSADM